MHTCNSQYRYLPPFSVLFMPIFSLYFLLLIFSIDAQSTIPAPTKATPAPATQGMPQEMTQYDDDLMGDSEDLPAALTSEELTQMEERRKKNDRTSKIMGEKLLTGWTMYVPPLPSFLYSFIVKHSLDINTNNVGYKMPVLNLIAMYTPSAGGR